MMVMTIQQLAKSIEVVQDILIAVYTDKESDNKKEKMKECIRKIKENKQNAAKVYKV